MAQVYLFLDNSTYAPIQLSMDQASLYIFSIVYSNVLPVVLQRLHVIAVTLLVSKAEGLLINRPLVHYRIGIQLPDTECLNPAGTSASNAASFA